MSRLDDLIDLIQTANEIYLANPDRNVRTAYILSDDLCELALKSYLQANVPDWNPTYANGRFKGFHTVVREARRKLQANQALQQLLDRFVDRRENRNHFFHNQELSGLTVTPENCLGALCDLYDLMAKLFPGPPAFLDLIHTKPILQAQIAVIRLKKKACQEPALLNRYGEILRSIESEDSGSYLRARGELRICHSGFAYEHCVISLYATVLYAALDDSGLVY